MVNALEVPNSNERFSNIFIESACRRGHLPRARADGGIWGDVKGLQLARKPHSAEM